MLKNLNTNYKILLGLSSIVFLGIIYSFMKNMFKPKTIENNSKIIEGITTNPTNSTNPVTSTNPNLSNTLLEKIHTTMVTLNENIRNVYEVNILNYDGIRNNENEKLFPQKIRKTMLHLSSIDTKGRSVLEPHKFTFNFGNLSNGDAFEVYRNVINIKCIEATVPYVPHNIYAEPVKNALFKNLTENSNKLSINGTIVIIEPGFYTINTLITTLNTLFALASPIPKFAFNNTTKSISVENVTYISDYQFTTTISNKDLSDIPEQQYPLLHRLGLNYVDFNVSASKVTGLNIPDLSIHYIDIIMNDLPSIATTKSGLHNNILIRIPMKGSPGDMIYHKTDYSDYVSKDNFFPGATTSNLSSISLDFLRNDGSEYNFEGIDFDIKLEITQVIDSTVIEEAQNTTETTVDISTDTNSTIPIETQNGNSMTIV